MTTLEICILTLFKKNQYFIMLLLETKIILLEAKVSVFQQDQIRHHRKPPQRSYLAQTLKQNYSSQTAMITPLRRYFYVHLTKQTAKELMLMKFIDLFSGIGGFRLGMECDTFFN